MFAYAVLVSAIMFSLQLGGAMDSFAWDVLQHVFLSLVEITFVFFVVNIIDSAYTIGNVT